MKKIYCNQCDKDVELTNDKCPNCGMIFNSDIFVSENKYAPNKNVMAITLKFIVSIIFLVGVVCAIYYFENIENIFIIALLCLLVFASAEIIEIGHDIRYKLYQNISDITKKGGK